GGFSPDALAGRIQDCDSTVVITADEGLRGGRKIPLKANTDEALKSCPTVEHCIVLRHTSGAIGWSKGRDLWYDELLAKEAAECAAVPVDGEDPLFILYTAGSTGKPKGVWPPTGGYLVFVALAPEYVFDYRDGDISLCTADV